jgi:hypothetical protein
VTVLLVEGVTTLSVGWPQVELGDVVFQVEFDSVFGGLRRLTRLTLRFLQAQGRTLIGSFQPRKLHPFSRIRILFQNDHRLGLFLEFLFFFVWKWPRILICFFVLEI